MEPPFTTDIVFEAAADGLGLLLMEDLAPGSAPILNLSADGIILARARKNENRDKILEQVRSVICQRRSELVKWVHAIRCPMHLAQYEAYCSIVWAGITASVPKAEEAFTRLIAIGWELAKSDIDDIVGIFLSTLISGACNSLELRDRDPWALRAFEPIVKAGAHWIERRHKDGHLVDDQVEQG